MYCLYIILHVGIIGLIIFLKPRLEPRLWAFSCCKPSPSPIQAHLWAGLGLGGLWALGFGPGPAHHYLEVTQVDKKYIFQIGSKPRLKP